MTEAKTLYSAFSAHIASALDALEAAGTLPAGLNRAAITVEPPRDASHGDLATNAAMALAKRAPTAGLLHHSDRGSQYAATSYQRVLDEYGLIPSMSRKGNCWDNACVESFFGTLKRELVYQRQYATRSEATQDIFEYIEVFYNRQRRHSTLGYHSPAEYEARAAVA